MQIERVILSNLIDNEEFVKRVLPYLKKEYFQDRIDQAIFTTIYDYIDKYKRNPSKEAVLIDIDRTNINDEERSTATDLISSFSSDLNTSIEWLINSAEEFCQDRAMDLALMRAIQIREGNDKNLKKGSIPAILTEALSISFDSNIGHDFFDDAEKQYEWYHRVEHKIPFEIDILNKITRGGVSRKTLTILMAGINVGKTAVMTGLAAAHLRQGKSVLYITMEMAEEEIRHRIDANMLDLSTDDVKGIDKRSYLSRIGQIKRLTPGKLKVKEFPTSKAGVNHFEALLNDLKLKQNFVPDIIYIDYLNICTSTRFKYGSARHEYVTAITEEIRGMAVEHDIAIISATQFNREGFRSSDPTLDNIAEAFGAGATADLILSIVRSEELDRLNQISMTQLKNRFSNKSNDTRFVVGVDINKMKFFDADIGQKMQSQQVLDDEDPFASPKRNKLMNSDVFEGFT